MNEKFSCAGRTAPIAVFLAVAVAVFLLIVITTTLVTFILPGSFAGVARILIEPQTEAQSGETNAAPSVLSNYEPFLFQTQFEIIQSEVVLERVIVDLDLNTEWGKRYAGGERLRTVESLQLLKGRLDLRPVRGTSLLEVRTYSEKPSEAALLANAVIKSYTNHAAASGRRFRLEVVDTAHPPLRPARPNKPLNLALGTVAGAVLGLGCGAFAAWILTVLGRTKPAPSSKSL